jgi:hypothetical protein
MEPVMKIATMASGLSLGALLVLAAPVSSARAMPLSGDIGKAASFAVTDIQYSSSRSFRSCMRQKYGPKYFRGVKRAHRYHMAQACGG